MEIEKVQRDEVNLRVKDFIPNRVYTNQRNH